MIEVKINSFYELLDTFELDTNTTIYRGQPNERYKLIPKAFRDEYIKINDEQAFNYFKRNGIAHINVKLENDWEYLAYAQHYNIPTRMLDWTFNPLVALFFSVNEMNKNNTALYKIDYSELGTINLDENPFQIQTAGIYFPRAITNRILAQKGLFTIHTINEKNSSTVFDSICTKYVINSKLSAEFAHKLHKFGFTHESLFPDLEGISKYIDWRWVNRKE